MNLLTRIVALERRQPARRAPLSDADRDRLVRRLVGIYADEGRDALARRLSGSLGAARAARLADRVAAWCEARREGEDVR